MNRCTIEIVRHINSNAGFDEMLRVMTKYGVKFKTVYIDQTQATHMSSPK